MFWRIGSSLDLIQDMTAKLYRTDLGSFLETTDNYLSVTKKAMFISEGDEDAIISRPARKNIILYTLRKTQGLVRENGEERDALIEENFMVGKKFQNIKIHMTHAFGFSEQEHIISFETDEPRDFLALAEELRQTPASKFTLRGLRVYTCRQRPLMECLDAIG
jgi:chlorite dismutase